MPLLLLFALLQNAAKPWTPDEAVTLSKTALKDGSEPKSWRPALKTHLDGFLERLGKDASEDSLRFVFKSFEEAFDETRPVVRAVPDKFEKSVLLLKEAKGTKAKSVLILCESADFDEIQDAVVVCTGALKARKLRKSFLLGTGKIQADECEDCVVFGAGDLALAVRAKHCTLLVQGKIESPEADDAVFINPGERHVDKARASRDVVKADLPKKK